MIWSECFAQVQREWRALPELPPHAERFTRVKDEADRLVGVTWK